MDQYAAYPFETDPQFQQGLREILSRTTGLDTAEAQLQARVFYFNRMTGLDIDVDQARNYEASREEQPKSQNLSFAQIQELIESGRVQDIPHNKLISGELNTEKPTDSQIPPRKKPWELDETASDS